jgi:predicted RNA binding protein YcfA (HicA-like mRNA interferase family)
MKVKEAIRMIEQDGWFMVRRRGSHRQYKHSCKKGNSIFKQAGLRRGRKKNA